MSILEVLTYPDNVLRQQAKLVKNINGKTQAFIDNMAETMYEAPGIGLAAIQVGCADSIVIYDIASSEKPRQLQVLINPKIIAKEGAVISENEGCLSLPDFRSNIKRSANVLVEALDRHGNPLRIEANGFHAIVLQHEIDHLNGVLFIDYVSVLKRQLYKRRIQKQRKKDKPDA